MSSSTLIKASLVVLAFVALSVGLPAAFAPETFYEDYPFFTAWINLLPPYNEHLITDVGGLYTGFGVMFVWALIRPSRQLILPLCVGWFVVQILHFAFHISHLEGFTTTETASQTIGLLVITLVPLIPIAILGQRRI